MFRRKKKSEKDLVAPGGDEGVLPQEGSDDTYADDISEAEQEEIQEIPHHHLAHKKDLDPYLPRELVAGRVPHVSGAEDESVHQVAAHALGSDRVSYVFNLYNGYLYYIACRSADLASNGASWCPIVSALPGGPSFNGHDAIHVYESGGLAVALACPERGDPVLRIGNNTKLRNYFASRGTGKFSRIGDITFEPEDARPWMNWDLAKERLQASLLEWFGFTGLALLMTTFTCLVVVHFASLAWKPDLSEARMQTQESSRRLVVEATSALESEAISHMVRIQSLLDQLAPLSGTLTKYEVKNDGTIYWTALVPPALSSQNLKKLNAAAKNVEPSGRMRIEGSR